MGEMEAYIMAMGTHSDDIDKIEKKSKTKQNTEARKKKRKRTRMRRAARIDWAGIEVSSRSKIQRARMKKATSINWAKEEEWMDPMMLERSLESYFCGVRQSVLQPELQREMRRVATRNQ